MTPQKISIDLKDDSLSKANLRKIRWCTTIAIIGFPVLVQILGAMIMFSSQYSFLTSIPMLLAFAGAAILVIGAGIYAITNRVFLRFSGANKGLEEWETTTQTDAFAFAYRIIVKGVLIAFVGISILGVMQMLNLIGWVNFNSGQTITLNAQAVAAFTVVVTYLVLLLPTLYIAWNIQPLTADDTAYS
ncbi:MAG: hypothetical protein ABJN22_04335 [Litorimonas sp.]